MILDTDWNFKDDFLIGKYYVIFIKYSSLEQSEIPGQSETFHLSFIIPSSQQS